MVRPFIAVAVGVLLFGCSGTKSGSITPPAPDAGATDSGTPPPLEALTASPFQVHTGAPVAVFPVFTGGVPPLQYAWTQTAGPAVSMDPTARALRFTAPAVQTDTPFSFSVVATDSAGTSANTSISVTVLSTPEADPSFDGGTFVGARVTGNQYIFWDGGETGIPPIGNPDDIEVGDFNLDSHPDLIVQSFTYEPGAPYLPDPPPEAPVYTLLNDGTGHFTVRTEAMGFQHGKGLRVADFNEDGFPDVFGFGHGQEYVDPKTNGEPAGFLFDQADGGFAPESTGGIQAYYEPFGPFDHAGDVGDVNGDGHADVLVSDFHDRSRHGVYAMFFGNGDGTFGPPVNILPAYTGMPFGCRLLDARGTGHLDLLAGDGNVPSLLLFKNKGDGTFDPAGVKLPELAGYPVVLRITPIDLNHDPLVDLAVMRVGTGYVGFAMQFLINDGDGHFEDVTADALPNPPSPSGRSTDNIEAIDIDGDGDTDLLEILMWQNAPNLVPDLWLNDGTGVFRPAAPHTQTSEWGHFAMDVNGDGLPDFLELTTSSTGSPPQVTYTWTVNLQKK